MEPESSSTMFIWTRRLSLSWATWIHPTPSHPITLKYILLLFMNLYLGLPIDLSVFPTKTLHTFKFSTYVPLSLYIIIILHVITRKNIDDDWKIVKLLIMKFSPFAYFSVPLKSKYLPQYPVFKHHLPMLFSEYERLYCYRITQHKKL